MALRLCPKTLPMRLNSLRQSRQFTSFIKPPSTPRTRFRPLKTHVPLVLRRNLFGLKRQTTESATKEMKKFAKICYRFTVYSGVFVILAIGGFFIYDVCVYSFEELTSSRRHTIRELWQTKFKYPI